MKRILLVAVIVMEGCVTIPPQPQVGEVGGQCLIQPTGVQDGIFAAFVRCKVERLKEE